MPTAVVVGSSLHSMTRARAGSPAIAGSRPGGIDVVVEMELTSDRDQPLVTPAPELSLGFELRVRDAKITSFTDMSALDELGAPLFTNARERESTLALVEGQRPAGAGVLARVELGGIEAGWLASPPSFRVILEPRSLRWIYYYVSADIAANKLQIIDSDSARSDAPIEFSSEPAPTGTGDRIADDLARTYPDRQRARLISTNPLVCSATPRARLSLRTAKTTLVDELPNPTLTQVSRLTLDGETQDFLHSILIS